MKYVYTGDKKININGMQYRKGDVVELDGTERVDWKRFVKYKEPKPEIKKKKVKKEVDDNGESLASKGDYDKIGYSG